VLFPDWSPTDQNIDSPGMEKTATFNPCNFTLAIKNKGSTQILAMGDLRGGQE
jgi:hypothetical protein